MPDDQGSPTLEETDLCVCGHRKIAHGFEGEKEICLAWKSMRTDCKCQGFDSERNHWEEGGGISATFSFTITLDNKEEFRKFKKIESYLRQQAKKRGKSKKSVTASTVFLYCFKMYGGPMEETEWMT